MLHAPQKLFFTFLTACLISFSTFAQDEGKLVRLNPINATGEVISVFEGANNIALIKITKADTAIADFEIIESEVVCTFEFGTKPSNGDPKLPGIKAGDVIRMEFIGTRDVESAPWNYRVFRYWAVKESPSSPKGEQFQK